MNILSKSFGALSSLLLAGLSMTAYGAEPPKVALACKGTVTDMRTPNAKPEPLSMGIIVDFTAKTILGLAGPGTTELVTITGMNDVAVNFNDSSEDPIFLWHIIGSLDRVTGDLEAISTSTGAVTKKIVFRQSLALKCRPAQRMF